MLGTPQIHPKPLPMLTVKAEANPSPSAVPKEGNGKLSVHRALTANVTQSLNSCHRNNKGSEWWFLGSCTEHDTNVGQK